MTPTQATTVSQHLHIEVEPEKAVDDKEDYDDDNHHCDNDDDNAARVGSASCH